MITEARQSFTIARKESHYSDVPGAIEIETVEIGVSSISKSTVDRSIGATSRNVGSTKFKLLITLTDGTTYGLKAMDSGRSWTIRREDSGRHNKFKTITEFMAAAVLPESKLNYHWQKIEGSEMKTEEYVVINGRTF
jgi:hypothetical protein